MKKPLLQVMVLSTLIALAVVPGAEASRTQSKQKEARTETQEYATAISIHVAAVEVEGCISGRSCVDFTPRKGEEYVSLEVMDATGTTAPFIVSFRGASTSYCGATDGPVWLNGAKRVWVSLAIATNDCQGVSTTGTVAATFSNLP